MSHRPALSNRRSAMPILGRLIIVLPVLLLVNFSRGAAQPEYTPASSIQVNETLYATADSYLSQVAPTRKLRRRDRSPDRPFRKRLRLPDHHPVRPVLHPDRRHDQLSHVADVHADQRAATEPASAESAYQVWPHRNMGGVSNLWSETGVNWNNQPATYAADDAASTVSTSDGWNNIGVTTTVRQWIENGASRNGLTLKGDGKSAWWTIFWSKEVTAAYRPRLVINYTPARNRHSHRHSNAHGYPDADSYPDADNYPHGHVDSYPHANRYPYGDNHPHADGHPHPHARAPALWEAAPARCGSTRIRTPGSILRSRRCVTARRAGCGWQTAAATSPKCCCTSRWRA